MCAKPVLYDMRKFMRARYFVCLSTRNPHFRPSSLELCYPRLDTRTHICLHTTTLAYHDTCRCKALQLNRDSECPRLSVLTKIATRPS